MTSPAPRQLSWSRFGESPREYTVRVFSAQEPRRRACEIVARSDSEAIAAAVTMGHSSSDRVYVSSGARVFAFRLAGEWTLRLPRNAIGRQTARVCPQEARA